MSFEAGLLQILIRMHVISGEDALALEQAYHASDINQFDEFLLSEGIVDEENLLQALSEYYQVPAFDVVGYFFEHHYVHMFPKGVLLRNVMIPMEVEGNCMIVVASNPNNPELLVELGNYVSYDIQFYVGIGRHICDAVEEFSDKADTEISEDEDIDAEQRLSNEEQRLIDEFYQVEEEGKGDESSGVFIEDEDNIE